MNRHRHKWRIRYRFTQNELGNKKLRIKFFPWDAWYTVPPSAMEQYTFMLTENRTIASPPPQ